MSWLTSFGDALQRATPPRRPRFSPPTATGATCLAFTWRLQTESGVAAIEAALAPTLARTAAADFHIPADRSPPRRVRRAGTDCIEAIFEFETAFGRANGVVRLVEEPPTAPGAPGPCSPRSRSCTAIPTAGRAP